MAVTNRLEIVPPLELKILMPWGRVRTVNIPEPNSVERKGQKRRRRTGAQPFERLEPSRGRGTGGAGLGLAIVEGLAESQGGSLTLENRPEGGLRATVRLQGA